MTDQTKNAPEAERLEMKQQQANPFKIFARLFGYLFKAYKVRFCIVVACILGASACTLKGVLFMQTLIDDYIIPLTQSENPDFGSLKQVLFSMILVYGTGIVCAYAYNRLMVNISQGTMRNLRTDLFTHMESLPIKYFDTNSHGDIMSVYTNDVDTLRQLMSQSIPQVINSGVRSEGVV